VSAVAMLKRNLEQVEQDLELQAVDDRLAGAFDICQIAPVTVNRLAVVLTQVAEIGMIAGRTGKESTTLTPHAVARMLEDSQDHVISDGRDTDAYVALAAMLLAEMAR
jgi:hypothetical protein